MRGLSGKFAAIRRAAMQALRGPQAAAFVPAIALAAYWLGGEAMLVAVALGLPLTLFALGVGSGNAENPGAQGQAADMVSFAEAVDRADDIVTAANASGLDTACFLIEIDGLDQVAKQAGEASAESLRDLMMTRLRAQARGGDTVLRVGDSRFAILLEPAPRLDLEALLQLASRVQSTAEEPASVDGMMRYFSASVGFCGSVRLNGPVDATRLMEAARVALTEAEQNGPSAIRAWTDTMGRDHAARRMLLTEVRQALANGQIQPWFQPQVCTSTGVVSGVEALARWIHPERGVVPPVQFLRCLEEAGQMSALATAILQHSLTALRSWDDQGIEVPRVSVNFSAAELRAPNIVERVKWELDRFGLPPHRLGIEVLETVLTSAPDAMVAKNVQALRDLGCFVELDDFGTGHASLTALATLKVDRLKIDRSYVSRIDRDENQRRMIAAVLGFAERLGMQTLAEGVETVGEHALVAQLGCAHVQGFGIARPMPVDKIGPWVAAHGARIAKAQALGKTAQRRT